MIDVWLYIKHNFESNCNGAVQEIKKGVKGVLWTRKENKMVPTYSYFFIGRAIKGGLVEGPKILKKRILNMK